MKIALVGDYNEQVLAHQLIPKAIGLASDKAVQFEWVHSNDIDTVSLQSFAGMWCVPASPYADMEKVLEAIHYARVNNIPFLGTCGGYQHAALEFARNALGKIEADNAEVNPDAQMPIIAALSCKLRDVEDTIQLVDNSFVQSIYGCSAIKEEYNCGFGVNAAYLSMFEGSALRFTGFDSDGDPRVLEIPNNDFFVGTAFQPERSAAGGQSHPLIARFIQHVLDT